MPAVMPAVASSASTRGRGKRKWMLISGIIIILFMGSLKEQQFTSEWIQQQQLHAESISMSNNTVTVSTTSNRTKKRRIPKRSPRRVYWCGYGNLFVPSEGGRSLAEQLFPEVEVVHIDKKDSDTILKNTTKNDVLLYGSGDKHTASRFQGTIVILNGESHQWWKKELADVYKPLVFPVAEVDLLLDDQSEGWGRPKKGAIRTAAAVAAGSNNNNTGINGDATDVKIYFMSMHFATLGKDWQERVLRQSNNPKPRGLYDTKPYFLLYLQSNCARHREKAFGDLSKLFNETQQTNEQQVVHQRKVHYGQKCAGRSYTNASNVERAPASKRDYKWVENYKLFQQYRFGLVMENLSKRGYMTEKIINAFLGGTIPIYYGSKPDVLEVFHPQAFVYWDIDNPQPAMERIRYLETNQTAYDEVLSGPILKDGDETIRKYFSWNDDLGNGAIKWFIRDRIGYG